MKNYKLSVVIGTYNQANALKKVLPSLFTQTTFESEPFLDYEVILVDSCSTDETKIFVESLKPKCGFQYIIQENSGKAGARNRGVAAAKSELILITDADMIADTKLVFAHLKAHENYGKPVAFEGLAYNMSELIWPINKNVKLTTQVGPDPKHLSKLGWYYFLTGNLSFPKKTFLDFNGFSPDFTGYGWEDLELGYRFTKAKIPILYLKTGINYHYHVVNQNENLARNIEKGRSARIMLQKHPELKLFLGLNPFVIFIYKLIKKQPNLYKWLDKRKNKGLVNYILKEYFYLKGLIDDGR